MQRIFHIALVPAAMLAIVMAANAQTGKVTCTYTSFKVLQGSQRGAGGINDSDWVSGSVQTGTPMDDGRFRAETQGNNHDVSSERPTEPCKQDQ